MEKTSIIIKIYRVYRFLWVRNFKISSRILYRITTILFNCIIPPHSELREGVNIAHPVGVVLVGNLYIGENTKIYQNVTIGGEARSIGANCYIGSGAVVLANLGDNVKVGANAVVLHDVPSNSTIVGVPGKIVKRA